MENIEKAEEERVSRKLFLKEVREYAAKQKHTLATTRFTNATWEENCRFREKNPNVRCAYTSPIPLSSHIAPESLLFVLEMNNETNRIMGVGLVQNRPIFGKYAIYTENIYNYFIYFGKWRIGVEDMAPYEREIMKIYEDLCFTGSKHMKRSHGITSFPLSIQYSCSRNIDLMDFICQMFKKRMAQNKI